MKGYVGDIENETETNTDYRRVLYTSRHLQLVLMSIEPGRDIGEEVHDTHGQYFRFESGSGEVIIDGVTNRVQADYAVVVPAGARHNVINTGSEPLKL